MSGMAALSSTLDRCQVHLNGQWPEPPDQPLPTPEGKTAQGILYGGNVQETVPKRLLLDSRLTPLERNAWLVFKILLDKQGFAVPRYQDLQPYLSMVPYGEKASKETVARVITNLRLTRWISLAARGRNNRNGQIQGALYLLHDEPMCAAEIVQLDNEYMELVESCLTHANKSVRLLAQGAMVDIQASSGELPTRLQVLAERLQQQSLTPAHQMQHYSEPGEKALVRNDASPGSDSELSEKSRVRNRAAPGSESEPSAKPTEINTVRNPNLEADVQYRTVLCTNTSTVPYSPSPGSLRWPQYLLDFKNGDTQLLTSLQTLPLEVQQAVLDEAGMRIAAGGIRNQASYLQSLIKRAHSGDFKPWATVQRTLPQGTQRSSPCTVAPIIREVPASLPRGPQATSEVAQACLEQMKTMVKNGAPQTKHS